MATNRAPRQTLQQGQFLQNQMQQQAANDEFRAANGY